MKVSRIMDGRLKGWEKTEEMMVSIADAETFEKS